MPGIYKRYNQAKQLLKPLVPKSVFKRSVNSFHALEATAANLKSGWPARSMKFIGVTGTNGKTTTTIMIAAILEAAGFTVGMNSSALIKDGRRTFENKLDSGLTNATPFTMQPLLKKMKKNGVEWVVMESASQALDQHRLLGITFEAAVFTNLTNEHLDYHGTMENYAKAKAILFRKTKGVSVINADSDWAKYFKGSSRNKPISYGKHADDYRILSIEHGHKHTIVKFKADGDSHTLKLMVQGEFNVYNALAALATTHELGVDLKTAMQALEGIERIPGRMDPVEAGQDFRVLIDYAHTPDAIKNVLTAARELTSKRLICITGAAGERPKSRRAPVGKLANELSDILVVTDDEPFGEDPDKIREELLSGVKPGNNAAELVVIPDRCEAMAAAFKLAEKGDTVVIAGMGHQKYRSGPNGKEPWNDHGVAASILRGEKNRLCAQWRAMMAENSKA